MCLSVDVHPGTVLCLSVDVHPGAVLCLSVDVHPGTVLCLSADVHPGTVLCLSADVRNIHADHAASHLGKAVGIITLIRAVPFHANRGHVYLPIDLMMQVVYRHLSSLANSHLTSKCNGTSN